MKSLRAHRPIRACLAAALALAVAAASCGGGDEEANVNGGGGDPDDGDDDDDGDGGDSPEPPPAGAAETACETEDDCVAVSSSCCDCPTFAVSANSDTADACGQIDCELPDDCPLVETACVLGQCQLVCHAFGTTRVCERGFQHDSFGCLTDRCRDESPDPLRDCQEDADCARVPADCCGCVEGGADTAVAAAFAVGFVAGLECPTSPSCPGLDVCDESLVPRCIAESCTLAPPASDDPLEPGHLCGVPEYPACPEGQTCVLNHPDGADATRLGVGTCADA